MSAMNYEILIRRAYNCGRYGKKGADADLYRALEREEFNALESPENDKIQVKYLKKLNEIKKYVNDALNQAIKKMPKQGDGKRNIERLLECIGPVDEATNKTQLSASIRTALDIFIELKIGFTD